MDDLEYQKIVEATNKAIKKGWDNTKIEWQKMALNTIYQLCLREPEISVNDFSEAIKQNPIKTHDNRAIGGAVVVAKKFHWIERTDRIVVRDIKMGPTSHRGPTAVIWKSLLYRGEQRSENPMVEVEQRFSSDGQLKEVKANGIKIFPPTNEQLTIL